MVQTDALDVHTRFGALTADARDVITMVDPVPGFETCRRYVVVAAPGLEPFACLQGLDGPKPSFLVVDPRLVRSGYAVRLADPERRRLDAGTDEPLLWLGIVRVTADGVATVNLRAPIVVNPARMTALQFVAPDDAYATDHPLE